MTSRRRNSNFHLIQDDAKGEYREAFELFDENNDGMIELKELKNMARKLNQDLSDEEIANMMKAVDKDNNGLIDFDEFINLMERYSAGPGLMDQMTEAFKVFDEDGDGIISAAELKKVMAGMNEFLKDEEVDEMIREIDMDGNGQIDYEEFVTLMCEKKGD